MRMRHTVFLVFFFLILGSCETTLTEIIVVVDTDMAVPAEVDHVRFDIDPQESDGESQSVLVAFAEYRPATLGLVHRSGPLGPFSVTAVGMRENGEVLSRHAEVSFIKNKVMMLRLDLYGACEGQTCESGLSCGENGDCTVVELVPWEGSAELIDADGDADGDSDGDSDSDADADGDVDGDVDGDIDGDADTDADTDGPCECDDEIDCTEDRCEAESCVHEPNDSLCSGPAEECTPEADCAVVFEVDSDCATSGGCDTGCQVHPCATIQEAFDSVEDLGDTTLVSLIRIREGTYTDDVTFNESAPVVIVGNPGTEWITTENIALELQNADVKVRNLVMSGAQSAIKTTGTTRLTLTDVTIRDCSQKGLTADQSSTITLDRCFVTNNDDCGIHGRSATELTVINSFIVGNGDGTVAGGFFLEGNADLTTINCTVADNNGGDDPGAVRYSDNNIWLFNTLMYNNGDPPEQQCISCNLTLNSINTSINPFVGDDGSRLNPNDYMIRAGTEPLNAGIRYSRAPEIDYFLEPRDENPDVGADEYVP